MPHEQTAVSLSAATAHLLIIAVVLYAASRFAQQLSTAAMSHRQLTRFRYLMSLHNVTKAQYNDPLRDVHCPSMLAYKFVSVHAEHHELL